MFYTPSTFLRTTTVFSFARIYKFVETHLFFLLLSFPRVITPDIINGGGGCSELLPCAFVRQTDTLQPSLGSPHGNRATTWRPEPPQRLLLCFALFGFVPSYSRAKRRRRKSVPTRLKSGRYTNRRDDEGEKIVLKSIKKTMRTK